MTDADIGRVPAEPGSHEPSPAVSAASGFDPSRVLFLDMDGVVLHGRALWAGHNNRHIPPEKIALVREVCARSGAVVVVSSTWRYSDETAEQLRFHGIPLHPDWRTDWRNDYQGSIIMGQRRGVEIFRWLARHPDTIYAIVDDDSDMLPEQMPRFVRTTFEDGIEAAHVERLVALLCDSDGSAERQDAEERLGPKDDSAGRKASPTQPIDIPSEPQP